ncbi:MAG: CheR family methyltransferase [Chthoniobacterales bacterium]
MLISVTSFFRNPEAFDALKRKVFPKLLARREGGDQPMRIWVLGCSTGQEAYSLAMTFAEVAGEDARATKLQIFATDLNEALLEKARHGLYPKSLAQDVSPERLRRFFFEEQGGFRVNKTLREQVVFARQNVMRDPPFSRMDLITCRNLLIYLEPELQKKIFPAFHYALKPDGYLFLGASESIGGFTELFAPADKKQKIFARKPAPTPAFRLPLPSDRAPQSASGGRGPEPTTREEALPDGLRGEFNAQREADRISVSQFAPPGVLINAEGQVLQFRGATGAYLEPPTGKASFDLLKMASEGLMLPLRAALNKAKRENKPVRREGVRIHKNGSTRTITLQIIPLRNLKERCFLILFEGGETTTTSARVRASAPPPAGKRAVASRIAELERELSETRDYLQSIQEQNEAANEELQASSEEVQSANEELQSINEELETSKEELESTNEELTTINDEMVSRNGDLSRLNADLNNLQVSLHTAILLLGRDLTIRRFTQPAEKIFNLLPTDVGRSFGGIRHNLDLPGLELLLAEVVDTVNLREQEVRDKDGHWYALRARPYLTFDNKVDGVVLVLSDIDVLKRSEQEITLARDYAEATLRTTPVPFLVLRADLRVNSASEAFYTNFQVDPAETEGRLIYEIGNGQWNIPKLRELLEEIIPQKNVFNGFEVTHTFARIGARTMLLNARRVDNAEGVPARILLAIEDITERIEAQAIVRSSQAHSLESAERFRFMAESMPQKIFTALPDGAVDYFNQQWMEFTGLSFEEIRGWGWKQFIHPDDVEETVRRWSHAVASGEYFEMEIRFRRHDGVYRWHLSRAHAMRDAGGQVRMWTGSNTDIEEVRQAAERFRFLAESMPQKIFTAKANGEIDYFNRQWMEFTGLSFEHIRDWGWVQFIHPDDVEENIRRWQHSVDTCEPFYMEHRVLRMSGEYRWHASRAVPRLDA